MAGGILRTSSWKEGAMQQSHLHLSGVVGDGNGEEAGIFVVHVNEIDSAIWSKDRKSQSAPVEQIA
jgi:hypothetical protein